MSQVNKENNSKGSWIFLAVVLGLFGVVYFVYPEKIAPILGMFQNLLLQILPILVLVYGILLLTNLFVDNSKLKKYMGEDAGVKGWIISIISGVLSVGPIYMWYPLMKDLQSKGVENKFLVTFLYNRGIKLQWLPMLILYFGFKYSVTLLIVMAIMSIPLGVITDKLISKAI